MNLYRRFLSIVDLITGYVIIAAMAGMVSLVAAQVAMRYLFSYSIDWSEELSRLLFVWAVMLAIPHGLKRSVHVSIDMAVYLLPAAARRLLYRTTTLLLAVLMCVAFYESIRVSVANWSTMMPTLSLSSSVYYLAVTVSSAHCLLHLAVLIAQGNPNPRAGSEPEG